MIRTALFKRLAFSVQPIVTIFLLLVTCYLLLVPSVSAQSKAPPNTNVESNVPNNLHNWTQTVMIEVMSALSCQLTGVDPINTAQGCLGVGQTTGKIGFLQENGGAIGVMGNMISVLYTPPAHTGDYFQNLAQNFGITKTSYAQTTGTGFDGLKPILPLWTGFRNVVYLIFVIVFIVIGLAIMLRIKIDPRTVMTIQNQIPKIIIGILLVTFSYAIAGFLIDMMYVSIHVIGNLIISADPNLDQSLPTQLARETNPFQAAGHVGANSGNAVAGLWSLADSPAGAVGDIVQSILVPPLSGNFFIRAIPNIFGGIVSWIAGSLAFLIIAIALLVALFRLWFTLISAYIYILIDIVLGPFWILGSLVPGSPVNVSGWLRDLLANLSAFPVTIAMFLLGKVFMDAFGVVEKTTQFVPPLIGNRASTEAIGAIIGLGIILLTPNVVTTMKAIFKAPKIDVGSVGKAIGVGLGAPGGLLGTASQVGHTAFGIQTLGSLNLPLVNKWLKPKGGGGH